MSKDILNPVELKIVKLICKQLSSREIGDQLGLSFRTIESYRLIILRKVKAKNLVGIALWAVKNGVVKA
jgi:two-component system, NarL family, invasion response regulator UvrY